MFFCNSKYMFYFFYCKNKDTVYHYAWGKWCQLDTVCSEIWLYIAIKSKQMGPKSFCGSTFLSDVPPQLCLINQNTSLIVFHAFSLVVLKWMWYVNYTKVDTVMTNTTIYVLLLPNDMNCLLIISNCSDYFILYLSSLFINFSITHSVVMENS